MKRPIHYYIIIAALVVSSCTERVNKKDITLSSTENIEIPPPPNYYLTSKETQRHAIFQYEANRDSDLFDNHVKPADLSKNEITTIEKLIAGEIVKYNKKGYGPVKQPEKYFKQLIPVINSKGEKEVWVDCFCSVLANWKTQPQIVNDGGSCFLHFKINLTKGKVLKFFTNGYAIITFWVEAHINHYLLRWLKPTAMIIDIKRVYINYLSSLPSHLWGGQKELRKGL